MSKTKQGKATSGKRWSVCVPFTGYVVVEVEGPETEQDAIDAAMEEELNYKKAEEVEFHRHVVQGNVCYATMRAASAEEIR